MPHSAPPRRATVLVFLLTLLFYAYFYQGGGPNQFSRLLLASSLAREGTVQIGNPNNLKDTARLLTIDRAIKDGHYYSDKAPGLSFLAALVYWPIRLLLGLLGSGLSEIARLHYLLYFMTLLAVSVPVAIAVAAFFRRAWIEAGPTAAFWVTLALGLGSPLAVYAGLFYAHALCAALLWLAFLLITPPPADGPDADVDAPLWRFALAGFLAGWSVLSEMPTALIAAALLVHVCLTQPRAGRAALAFVAGGLPCAALLLVYNTAAFGGPLENGYQYLENQHFKDMMSRGLMGVTGPTLESVWGVFLGAERGLLFAWPFFFLAVLPALAMLIAGGELRGTALLCAVVVGVYLLFACSYFQWDGGMAFGPRHVIPCLPFAAYLVVLAWRPLLVWLAAAGAVLSAAVALMVVSTIAELPERDPRFANPLLNLTWEMFRTGDLSVKAIIMPGGLIFIPPAAPPPGNAAYYDACNLGELFGLSGLLSLVPLALVLGLFLAALATLCFRGDEPGPPP